MHLFFRDTRLQRDYNGASPVFWPIATPREISQGQADTSATRKQDIRLSTFYDSRLFSSFLSFKT
jgi:hypothetical protein